MGPAHSCTTHKHPVKQCNRGLHKIIRGRPIFQKKKKLIKYFWHMAGDMTWWVTGDRWPVTGGLNHLIKYIFGHFKAFLIYKRGYPNIMNLMFYEVSHSHTMSLSKKYYWPTKEREYRHVIALFCYGSHLLLLHSWANSIYTLVSNFNSLNKKHLLIY